jgi:voltage-gated potassium channel Kch
MWAFKAVAAYRIFDILQTTLNVNLFAPLRRHAKPHYVASLARMVLLAIWNFLEIMICFAALYYSNRTSFRPQLVNPGDAIYFSAITQLTIGYGDFLPLGPVRLMAALQGFLGFLLALFALSRIIAFLPRTEPVFRDD